MVAVIPARRGSSLPAKNLRKIHGRSLLERAIDCAEATPGLSADIVVSSDCPVCLGIAKHRGCWAVPRPAAFATAAAPSIWAARHALAVLRSGGRAPDAICLLQPTNPLRRPSDVQDCIDTMTESGCGSVNTVAEAWGHPARQLWADTLQPVHQQYRQNTRRQDLRPVLDRDGSVYLTRAEWIDLGQWYAPDGLVVQLPKWRHLDIEDEGDLRIAAALLGA